MSEIVSAVMSALLDLRSRQGRSATAFLPNALAFEVLASSIALVPRLTAVIGQLGDHVARR
jgi:hypothetical protein